MTTPSESTLPVRAPKPNLESQPFWDATAEGRIDLPQCRNCDLVIFYPRLICPDCQSTDIEWKTMAGTGTIYTYSIDHRPASKTWREHAPYVIAYVELDEGPRMITNIVDCDPADIDVGMAVTAVFDDTGEGNALVRFRPTGT